MHRSRLLVFRSSDCADSHQFLTFSGVRFGTLDRLFRFLVFKAAQGFIRLGPDGKSNCHAYEKELSPKNSPAPPVTVTVVLSQFAPLPF